MVASGFRDGCSSVQTRVHFLWGVVAARWYTMAAPRHALIMRVSHNLAILERPSMHEVLLPSERFKICGALRDCALPDGRRVRQSNSCSTVLPRSSAKLTFLLSRSIDIYNCFDQKIRPPVHLPLDKGIEWLMHSRMSFWPKPSP